jgi:hypothetical protein
MTTLEERVARLEAGQERIERDMQEARHGLRAGLGAHSMAIGLVYEDTQAIRAELAEFRAETTGRLTGIESTLATILDRLPPRT